MTTEKQNAKQRLDVHEEFIARLIAGLDRQRKNYEHETAELRHRIERLENTRWMVRLNDIIRKVWR